MRIVAMIDRRAPATCSGPYGNFIEAARSIVIALIERKRVDWRRGEAFGDRPERSNRQATERRHRGSAGGRHFARAPAHHRASV